MKKYDVIIIGGGAAGLAAARAALQNGRHVAILDMGSNPARKVIVSGGGRCNITNVAAARDRYFGANPDFVRGALARVTPADVLAWMQKHNLSVTEKSPGQYFCATSAVDVVNALVHDVRGADIFQNISVTDADKQHELFVITTNTGTFAAPRVIVASGGTSFATLGVSDVGWRIAKKFGHSIVPPRPALCGIATNAFSSKLAGITVDAEIIIGKEKIKDSMLFTHFGIGGPAAYRATVRNIDTDIKINIMPGIDAYAWLREQKQTNGKKSVVTILATKLPTRLAKFLAGDTDKNIADMRDIDLRNLATQINSTILPQGTFKLHNLTSAEVVRGGVNTAEISSKTMESKLCPGLFFAGEVIDVAGDLGGFNLHWAWASGTVAGDNM